MKEKDVAKVLYLKPTKIFVLLHFLDRTQRINQFLHGALAVFYKAGGIGGTATRTFRFDDLILLITENVNLFGVNVRLFQQISDFFRLFSAMSNFLLQISDFFFTTKVNLFDYYSIEI